MYAHTYIHRAFPSLNACLLPADRMHAMNETGARVACLCIAVDYLVLVLPTSLQDFQDHARQKQDVIIVHTMAAPPATTGVAIEVPACHSSSQVGPVPPELETENTCDNQTHTGCRTGVFSRCASHFASRAWVRQTRCKQKSRVTQKPRHVPPRRIRTSLTSPPERDWPHPARRSDVSLATPVKLDSPKLTPTPYR